MAGKAQPGICVTDAVLQAKLMAQHQQPSSAARLEPVPDAECLNTGLDVSPQPASTCSTAAMQGSSAEDARSECKLSGSADQQPRDAIIQHISAQACTDAESASSECVICWEAVPDVVLQPCGHMCVCSGCAALLAGSSCPICRCEVQCNITLQL